MKNYYLLTLILLITISCNDDEKLSTENITEITGEWINSEAKISAGAEQYWTDVTNGTEYTFSENGTFKSTRFSSCDNGTYQVIENELILEYACDNDDIKKIENSNGKVTYIISLEQNSFILSPTSGPLCIEGCSYRYINNN